MNRAKRHIMFLMLVIALLALSTSVVFAKELGLLTISGPGIKGEMTIKSQQYMADLEASGFFDQTAVVKPPEKLGEGYQIAAHLNLDGKLVPMVEMVYYPTTEGQPGYVHYTGRLIGDTLQSVDRWQVLTPKADKAFRDLMQVNKVALQPAFVSVPVEKVKPAAEVESVAVPAAPAEKTDSVSVPVTATTPVQTPYLILAAVATILLLVGAGLVLKRRAMGNPTT